MARQITLRQVEAFKAMIETGTVARAAEMLNVSQPAISKLLGYLEEDTGLQLFERARGRLVPTARAMRLYEEVDRVFAGIQQIQRSVDLIRREEQGHLVVGVMPALSQSFITGVLTEFLAANPGVYISVISRNSRFIADRIRTRHIDVGVINADIADPDLDTEAIMARALVCIMPFGHPLAAKPEITAQDLEGVRFISFESSNYTSKAIEICLAGQGVKPQVVIEATTASTICALVAAGHGISLVHPVHVQDSLDRVVVRPFKPEIGFHLRLCRRRDFRNARLLKSFVDAVRLWADGTGLPAADGGLPLPAGASAAAPGGKRAG